MNIIFLDIDGVLNCKTSKSRCGPFFGIDNAKVKLLRQLVDASDARIVLTSTWKMNYEAFLIDNCDRQGKYLYDKLRQEKIYIFDTTKEKRLDERGRGIDEWLAARRDIDKWLVIDDEIFKDYEKYNITSHLLKTNWETGLTPELTQLGINYFNFNNIK